MNIAVGNDKIPFEEWVSKEEFREIYHKVMKPWNVIGEYTYVCVVFSSDSGKVGKGQSLTTPMTRGEGIIEIMYFIINLFYKIPSHTKGLFVFICE